MIRAKFARSIGVVLVLLICSLVLLISSLVTIARAEDESIGRTAANYGGEPGFNRVNGSPLLPCPRSVPCLPAASYGEAGHLPPAVASAGLLPCPLSVPCFPIGEDLDVPISRKAAPPAFRVRRSIAPRSRSARASRLNLRTRALTPTRIAFVPSSGESPKLVSARSPGAAPGEMALRGDAAYQRRARVLLNEVKLELGRLDRTALDANKLQVYAKATDFTTEAVKALRARDNLAALGFAEKAQVLSADLGAVENK